MQHRARAVPEAPPVFRGGRFEIVGRLGIGGFGTVFEALDHELERPVAIKVLHGLSPESLLDFKAEFRALQSLRHPNLAELYALFEQDGQWCFSMELVPGWDLLEYVRTEQGCDFARLRQCAVQLARALSAVHASGFVHRDVKPSNVRVTPEGRLVLLDFGLVVRAGAPCAPAGTPCYMAPEQGSARGATAAADWYAMGSLLYESLVGEAAFDGASSQMMLTTRRAGKRAPSTLAPETPADLDGVCVALLSPEPERRPSAEAVLRVLHASSEKLPSFHPLLKPTTLVGRDPELERLTALFDASEKGTLALGLVEGDSGLGKSALLDEITSRAEQSGAIVLRARCRENETIAYGAVDGAVDSLTELLDGLSGAECERLLPPAASLLTVLFPVLASVRALVNRPPPEDVPRDPTQLREYCFFVFRRLLHSLSQRRRVVLVLDDLQWADEESLALLDELFRAPEPPALCVLAGVRVLTDSLPVTPAWARWQESAARIEHCVLRPLDHADARTLAQRLVGDEHSTDAERIARESGGHPLFIEVLARQSEGDLRSNGGIDDAITALTQRLSKPAIQLLAAVTVAGHGTSARVLSSATGVRGDALHAASGELCARRLMRIKRGLARDLFEPYHDRMRLAVERSLDPTEHAQLHARLAEALTLEPHADLEALAHHWHNAGIEDRAVAAALGAAERAAEALAFEKAAALYAWALGIAEAHPDAGTVRKRRAEMLARAGKSVQAAEAYRELLGNGQGEGARDVRAKLALHLIRSGRIEEGLDAARAVTAEMGISLPTTQRGVLARTSWLWLRRRFKGDSKVRPPGAVIDADKRWRVDTLYELSSSLGPVSAHHGMVLHFQHVIEALDLGEPGRMARALAFDSLGLYYMGAKHRIPRQLSRVQALAAQSSDPHIVAMCRFGEGLAYALLGETRRAVALMLESETELLRHGVDLGWVVTGLRTWRLYYTWRLGEYASYLAEMPLVLRDARRTDEPYLRSQVLAIQAPPYYLALDQPERAATALEQAALLVKRPQFGTQDWFALTAKLRLDCYSGDAQAATRFLARWPEVRASSVVRVSYLASEAFLLHGLALLATRGADACREALTDAGRLEKRGSAAEALLVRAAVALRRDDREASVQLLEQAETLLAASEAFEMVGSVRYARSKVMGAARGYPLQRALCDELARSGIVDPARFLACQLPGLVDDALCR